MTKLLNFNPDRKLNFDSNRDLQFSPNREFGFDLNRELSFDLNRDLGFGKRGVVFRGYVCSSCGALVDPQATECDECGAIFETEHPKEQEKRAAKRPRFRMRFCPYCGHQVSSSDTYCSYCGSMIRPSAGEQSGTTGKNVPGESGYDVLKLPSKSQKKTVMDWKETGKDFEDFLEK